MEAFASLFLSLPKIITMKFYSYLFIILTIVSSCKEEEDAPTFSKDYGRGMYVSTDNGVTFYKDGVVKNQIYKEVNGQALTGVEKIKFKGTKAYILAEHDLFTANIETFEDRGTTGSFVSAVDFEFVNPDDRMFVVDRGDSKVKVINIDRMEITSDIETGDITKPVFIVTKWYRSIVMNGGAEPDSLKDSTIVAIDYRDELVPLADMMGSLFIGDNPNSAVNINDLAILCKGIYDPNNMANNTTASLVKIDPWDLTIDWTKQLNNIYNAKNLTSNNAGSVYFFTAADGVYSINPNGNGIGQVLPIISDVLFVQNEQYFPTDSTTATSNMLYINDSENNPNTIYKYNLVLSNYVDTIIVNGNVRDINFY